MIKKMNAECNNVGVGGWSRVLPWTCCGAICPSGIMNNDEGMRIEEATKQNPKIVGKKQKKKGMQIPGVKEIIDGIESESMGDE